MSDKVVNINIAMGTYPIAELLKEKQITRPNVNLDFPDYPTINRAFAPMVRKLAFDVSELALVTFLQALDAGKPLRLLPFVVVGRQHHEDIIYNPAFGKLAPEDLEGKKVGMRAYSQTTGMWVRSILQHEYNVDLDKVNWIAWEGTHVQEYTCPENVTIQDQKEFALLEEGGVDAVLGGLKKAKDKNFATLIPDPKAAAKKWTEEHNGMVMINHMICVTEDFLQREPEAVQALYDMLREASDKTAPGREGKITAIGMYGADNIWNAGAIQLANKYCIEQKLVKKMYDRSEIFAEVKE